MSTNWMEKTIVPKSDQLNAEDLLTGPITVTIKAVHEGNAEQSMVIDIEGPRPLKPYKPCKTMRRVLIALWGAENDGRHWIGRQVTLYLDKSVRWAGDEVGGIRISHMSHLDGPKTLKLSESKGKRKACTVQPLATPTAKTDERVSFEDHRARIEKALSSDPSAASAFAEIWDGFGNSKAVEDLEKLGKEYATTIKTFDKDVQAKIKAWYLARVNRLKAEQG